MTSTFGDEEIEQGMSTFGDMPVEPVAEEQLEAPVTATPAQPPGEYDDLLQRLVSGQLDEKQMGALNELSNRGKLSEKFGEPFSVAALESGLIGSTRPESVLEAGKKITREALPALIRPALEATPAIALSMAGAAGGGPAGAVAGGALGYAGGKTIADRIEAWAQPAEDKKEQVPVIEELGILFDDLLRGLTFEFGGAAAAKTVGALIKMPGFIKNQLATRFPAMSEKEISKRAADIIEANTGTHPQYQKNIEASQEVIEEIPGLKGTMGDISGDPGLIKLQRGLETQPGQAAEKEMFKRAENLDAIKTYLKSEFPGNEGIDEVLNELTRQKTALGETTKAAETTALSRRAKVTPEAPQATGERISAEIEAAREPVRKIEKEYWDKVPNYKMKVSETEKVFEELSTKPSTARETIKKHLEIFNETPRTVDDMHVVEQELNDVIFDPNSSNTVKRSLGKVKTALAEDFRLLGEAAEQGDFATYKGEVVHPKQLTKELETINQKLAKEVQLAPDKIDSDKMINEMREAKQSGIMQQYGEDTASFTQRVAKDYTRNFGKTPPMIPGKEKVQVTSYKSRKDEIERTLAGAEEAQNAAIAYKNAKEYSKSQSFGRFGKGVVAELRQSGKYADGKKIVAEQRPKKLMSVSSADQFIKAVGKDTAGDIMVRHYADDMMNNVKYDDAGQLQSKSLSNWVNKNKRVLERYGIADHFKNVDTAHASMANAQQAEKQFNNSIAEKMLDSDPQNAIARALTGGEGISAKNTGDIMRKMVGKVQSNKKAEKGLENAFQNFMIETMETTAKTIKGDSVLSNATLSKAMRRYKPAMAVLYKNQPGKIKALQTVEKAISIQNRTAKSPIGGGSDTAEKVNSVANIIGTIVSHTPGVSYAAKLTKLGLGSFKNLNVKETNDMVSRLLHDPELAQIIIRASRKNPNTKKVSADLGRYMATVGLRKVKDLTGKTMEEESE